MGPPPPGLLFCDSMKPGGICHFLNQGLPVAALASQSWPPSSLAEMPPCQGGKRGLSFLSLSRCFTSPSSIEQGRAGMRPRVLGTTQEGQAKGVGGQSEGGKQTSLPPKKKTHFLKRPSLLRDRGLCITFSKLGKRLLFLPG